MNASATNTDYQARVWIDLQRPDGRTLELESGERGEVVLPDDFDFEKFDDPYLKLTPTRKAKKPEQEQSNA